MADSGGHWKTLAEAQKLTQAYKIPGVFEEDIKRNNPLDRLPVAQAAHTGRRIEWLREKTTTEDAVTEIDIGEQLSWSDDIEYTEVNSELKRVYIQRKLDHYIENIYGTYTDYKARKLIECEKGLKRRMGARIIYGDTTYTSDKQFDGLHALAAERGSSSDLNIGNTNSTGLSLQNLRTMIDAMKYGCDELWMPFEIVRRMDAAYQEKGFVGLASGTAGSLAFMTLGYNEAGKRVLFWDGIPIIRTDYLVGEEMDTGTGASSDARALYSSDKCYSIFGLRFGNVMEQDPGICLAYGGTEGAGEFYKLVVFPELEDYDAGGIRLVSYASMLLGSTMCLGRIYDIDDAAILV